MNLLSFVSYPACDPALPFCLEIYNGSGNICARRARVVNTIMRDYYVHLKEDHDICLFLGLQNFFLQKESLLCSLTYFHKPSHSGIYHPGDAAAAPRPLRYEPYLITGGLFRTSPPIVNTAGPAV